MATPTFLLAFPSLEELLKSEAYLLLVISGQRALSSLMTKPEINPLWKWSQPSERRNEAEGSGEVQVVWSRHDASQ